MSRICVGCGSILQSSNVSKEGYVKEEILKTAEYCERCYKIIHYGEFSILESKIDFDNLIKKINEDLNSSVVFLIDLLNINEETINYLKKFINKNMYVLLTKRDILPKSVKDDKLINYFKDNYLFISNVMVISSEKKKNIDEFLNKVRKDGVKKLYVVGVTNSGKSTFINALLSSVGEIPTVTTSALPNTTANFIEIRFDGGLTIIDTPGFLLENSIYNTLNYKETIKLQPKKEIKVKTFQIKPEETILVNEYLRLDYLEDYKNSFSFYMNNNLNYTRMKTKNSSKLKLLNKVSLHLNDNEDIVISGLGFVKVTKACKVDVYVFDEKLVSVRKNMI